MLKSVQAWLPDMRLSDMAFAARHRVLLVVLWLQVPLLFGLAMAGLSEVEPAGGAHWHGAVPGLLWTLITGVAICAAGGTVVTAARRRTAALFVSAGLLLAASALIPAGGGLTDLHFAFFVVLGLISVYQDWTVLAFSVVLVAAHHLITGYLAPWTLYSDPTAYESPVKWAALHVGFVIAMCAVEVAYWRFAQNAEHEKDDIRLDADRALRHSEERFRAIVQDSSDVIHVIDGDGRIMSVSPGVERVTGYNPEGLVGTAYRDLIHPDDRERLDQPDGRSEVRTRHADGSWHWHDVTMRDLSGHPAVRGLVANHRDITERRTYQELLMHEASHDALTGLMNRSAFLRELADTLREAAASGERVGVLYLDLDGFKQVNDTYGHDSGDALLVATAKTLRQCVLGSDVVGRLGGDEFVIMLRAPRDCARDEGRVVENAAAVARRIVRELKQPISLQGRSVRPRASAGIAVSNPDSVDTDLLLHHADTAMYHAKREQSGGWRDYVEGMHDPRSEEGALEDDLRRAVDEGQLRLWYQPIVELPQGRPRAFEALVRWQHPELGLLQPGSFVSLAEQSGLINEIGAWVLEHACAQMREWQLRYADVGRLSLSVNVSPHQLDEPSLVADVADILARTGLDARDLVLEVTESALVKDSSAIPQLNGLNDLGIRIALDDFGTGYSSLRYLTRLPVDILKLDRHFVGELNGTPEGSAVAESVVRLGQILHLEVVAEGIENPAQSAELVLLGFSTGQGFHYARPLPPAAVESLLSNLAAAPAGPGRPLTPARASH